MMKNKYDCIIAGAGIGGLVCGNYLAMAGRKVLLLEKNNFAGGCCSSFLSRGFFFDSGPHVINEVGVGGAFKKILEELGVYHKNDFISLDPAAVIFTGDAKYVINVRYKPLCRYFKLKFPRENIKGFFSLLTASQFFLYHKLKNIVFTDLLDQYFSSSEIKAIFCSFVFPLGTLPDKVSAFYALKFLRSTLLSGGYYPRNGMQSIAEKLMNNLARRKGRIILNRPVKKILIKNGKAYGVMDAAHEVYYGHIIISNMSPANTWGLLDKNIKLTGTAKERMSKMDLSHSALVVHVALKKTMKILSKKTIYVFINLAHFKRNKITPSFKKQPLKIFGFVYMPTSIFQTTSTLKKNISGNLTAIVPYRPRAFWEKYKDKVAKNMIQSVENIAPGFKENILFKKISTPDHIELYTGNNNGAIGGWAANLKQAGLDRFSYVSPVKNLLFTGHWTFPGVGISSAAASGRNTAKIILSQDR